MNYVTLLVGMWVAAGGGFLLGWCLRAVMRVEDRRVEFDSAGPNLIDASARFQAWRGRMGS